MTTVAATLAAARVVTSDAVHEPGWVAVEGGRIAAVGAGPAPAPPSTDFGHRTLVPGFVDMHAHGGGGAAYTEGSARAALAARSAHLSRGTTTSMASLVTDTPQRLLDGVRMLAGLVRSGDLGGIHLEGPWLSPARAGAHAVELLREPVPSEIDALLDAAGGALSMVTIAPELPGSFDAIARFVDAGVRVAVGHTDADLDCTRRAIDAGATIATHLFNAMPPLHHRDPGPVLALLSDPRVVVELVADGTHLHPELARWAASVAGASRSALVTDAMSAAGCGDGEYRLGSLEVEVSGGVARLAGTQTIAGSTATMNALFRSWVRPGGFARAEEVAGAASGTGAAQLGAQAGEDEAGRIRRAVLMASTNPARALGWEHVGDIAPGKRADLAVLDRDLRVEHVLLDGEDISTSRYPEGLG